MEDNTDSERELYKIIQDLAILSENLKNGGGLSGDNMQLLKQTIRPARFILEVIRYISCPLPNMDPLIEKEDPLVVADPVQDPPVVADDVSFHASLMQLFHSEQETQDELNSARLTCYHFVRGWCKYGDQCKFQHTMERSKEPVIFSPLYRTCMCANNPPCPNPTCFFAHNIQELRVPPYCWRQRCTLQNCKFVHDY